MNTLPIALQWTDWLALFGHYLLLSLLSVGGVVTTAPEMHRYLVDRQHWLSDAQFNASIALAQAAPGPNALFVALLGWNIGMNAGGTATAVFGMALTLTGMLLPSTLIAYHATRWTQRNRELRSVRAFKLGMAPLVIALVIATGWILARADADAAHAWPLWVLTGATVLLVYYARIHLLWLLALGAVLGALGVV